MIMILLLARVGVIVALTFVFANVPLVIVARVEFVA